MSSETKGCLLTGLGIIAFISIIFFFMSISKVDAGFVGVVTRWGAVNRTVGPGLVWRIPIAESVKKMDIRTKKSQIDTEAASSDLQLVTATIAVNYHLDKAYALSTFEAVGVDYTTILLDPAIENMFKAATAKFSAEQLITDRESARISALNSLSESMQVYHIIIENFNIVNFDFSKEFNDAIEQKQVAQQQVEQAKQLLEKAKVEAQTAITQAQGQADAQAALKNTGALTPEYLNYIAIQKWNGVLPLSTGGAIPFIDLATGTPSSGR